MINPVKKVFIQELVPKDTFPKARTDLYASTRDHHNEKGKGLVTEEITADQIEGIIENEFVRNPRSALISDVYY